METKSNDLPLTPPALIPSILAGFNAVAGRIYIILLPAALDLLLWFGPRLRIRDLLLPTLERATKEITPLAAPAVQQNLSAIESVWRQLLENFNLLALLRTFPVGIPSLMAGSEIGNNPLGQPTALEVGSLSAAIFILIAVLLAGFILGGVFFSLVARSTQPTPTPFSISDWAAQVGQALTLTLVLIGVLLLFGIPSSVLIGIFVWISPNLAQFALILLVVVLLWFLMPLLFSPHGIFTNRLTAFTSVVTSVRMVRYYLPGTGLFLLILLVISQGMDLLWRIPSTGSWMTLVGILGHAFISSSLLASSFMYYRGGLEWMQANIQRMKAVSARG
jgi:hypothetical protein